MNAALTWLCVALYLFGWWRFIFWWSRRYLAIERSRWSDAVNRAHVDADRRIALRSGAALGSIWPLACLGLLILDAGSERLKQDDRVEVHARGQVYMINGQIVTEEEWRNYEGHAGGGPDTIDEEQLARRERELGIEMPPLPPREL